MYLYGFGLHAAVRQRFEVAGQILLEMFEDQKQHQLTFALGALAVANVQQSVGDGYSIGYRHLGFFASYWS